MARTQTNNKKKSFWNRIFFYSGTLANVTRKQRLVKKHVCSSYVNPGSLSLLRCEGSTDLFLQTGWFSNAHGPTLRTLLKRHLQTVFGLQPMGVTKIRFKFYLWGFRPATNEDHSSKVWEQSGSVKTNALIIQICWNRELTLILVFVRNIRLIRINSVLWFPFCSKYLH